MTAETPTQTTLTLEDIDQAIIEYESAQRLFKAAKDTHDAVKDRLVFLVESFGTPPPHTEKSKRLTGRHNTATITFGTTVNVNPSAVLDFDLYLEKERLGGLSLRFFARQTKYVLVEGATDVLKTLSLSRRVQEKIASLFGRCIDVRDKTPSLKVETIQPEKPVRKPRKGKAAA